MNDWYDYAKDRRAELVAAAISVPESLNHETFRWAVFCAAAVEYLCDHYGVPCPSWVHNPIYCLPEPWFDAPMAHKTQVRKYLTQQTPEPFTRRNIYCGNRMFANKYELVEQYRCLLAANSSRHIYNHSEPNSSELAPTRSAT